jgi:hypothetical protein
MKAFVFFCVLLSLSAARAQERPTLYISPAADGFEMYLSAAIQKKHVPVTIVTRAEDAEFVLESSAIHNHAQPAAARYPPVECKDCGPAGVQLLKAEAVTWSYVVTNGRGQKNPQSLADEIAKHLKADYFNAN